MFRIVIVAAVFGSAIVLADLPEAKAQTVVTGYYQPAPTAVGYVPVRRGLFGLRTGWAPVVVQPTPVPVTTMYAPTPVTTMYAPTPVTTYYAPSPTVSTYYAPIAPVVPPVTTYYAPAPSVYTYYPPPAVIIGR